MVAFGVSSHNVFLQAIAPFATTTRGWKPSAIRGVPDEMNARPAFRSLPADTAKLPGWTLGPELSEKAEVA